MVLATFDAWNEVKTWVNVNTGEEKTCAGKDLPHPAQYMDTDSKAIFYFDNQNTYRFSGYGESSKE